ncbi:HIT family protein [Auraticoccus monumenti]|uniref:Diadenosine tetraphosphate (Ap4A) hydrolase n=1 Tax=Auraticoccus monumenti TaxID=675864 RepID=A0A1G7C445_9ACTN|nr:HIT domain-containing protein [Auraticoccus monumenti]SDE33446.1 Diadenosine tetraphosphate (Ap4A) hydrolase [Auraticoccus monumenti]
MTGAEPHAADDPAVGVPDAFQRLWTPHRMVYIGGQDKPADDSAGECPFCRAPQHDDESALVVHRGEHAFVVLNLYPYSPGHLLVCPYRHVSDWTEVTDAERDEVSRLTQTAMRTVRRVSAPHGFNLGMNQGSVAGAGIAAHLHAHVVPRWSGDANFLPVIGQTKAVPQLLGDTWALLHAEWGDEAPASPTPGGPGAAPDVAGTPSSPAPTAAPDVRG